MMAYKHENVTGKYPCIPKKLKRKQVDILNALCKGKDTLGILPTGYGKTLCFVLPALQSEKVALVVSPLKALQDNQECAIKKWGVTCAVLNEDTDVEKVKKGIEDHLFKVIIATPEAIAGETWQKVLLGIRTHICVVCFDEAHVVITWGKDFRESYDKCSELRSMFACPFLLLSATLPNEIQQELCVKLKITDPEIVTTSLDRPNIALIIRTEPGMDICTEAGGLLGRLRVLKQNCPKCIIFTGTIAGAVKAYEDMMMELWGEGYASGVPGDRKNALIALFHGKLTTSERKRVLELYSKPDSVVRVVIATTAFSLGVHIEDVATIIQFGTPKDVNTFWQQAGRAGRDGRAAECLLIATRTTYHRQKTCIAGIIARSMKGEVKCLRQEVLDYLGGGGGTYETRKPCCNLCDPAMAYLAV